MVINYLTEPIDVFSEWVDECEKQNKEAQAAARAARKKEQDEGGEGDEKESKGDGVGGEGEGDGDEEDDLDGDAPLSSRGTARPVATSSRGSTGEDDGDLGESTAQVEDEEPEADPEPTAEDHAFINDDGEAE